MPTNNNYSELTFQPMRALGEVQGAGSGATLRAQAPDSDSGEGKSAGAV